MCRCCCPPAHRHSRTPHPLPPIPYPLTHLLVAHTLPPPVTHLQALVKYPSAIALQVGLMTLALWGLQQASDALGAASLPGALTGEEAQRWLVTAFFLVTSLRSRIFCPLDASRPELGKGGKGFSADDPKRPSWMPPAVTVGGLAHTSTS